MSKLPIERIKSLSPASGWFAIYYDEGINMAFADPVAVWAALEPSEDEETFGVIGLVTEGTSLVPASDHSGFVAYADETEAIIRLNALNKKGTEIQEDTRKRFGERLSKFPVKLTDAQEGQREVIRHMLEGR